MTPRGTASLSRRGARMSSCTSPRSRWMASRRSRKVRKWSSRSKLAPRDSTPPTCNASSELVGTTRVILLPPALVAGGAVSRTGEDGIARRVHALCFAQYRGHHSARLVPLPSRPASADISPSASVTDPTFSTPPAISRPDAPRLFLVDGYALIYRAFFALISRPLTTARGENTSAAWGVVNFLQRLIDTHRPEYVA